MKQLTRKGPIKRNLDGFDMPVLPVGKPTEHCTVLVDKTIGQAGVELAEALLSRVEDAFQSVVFYFGSTTLPPVTCILSALSLNADGTGGAYHWSCAGTNLYVDADLRPVVGVDRCLALFVAELAEVAAAQQKGGLNCGTSHGEGMSRFIAQVVCPGVLTDYASAPKWLNGSRQNWIGQNENTDSNEEANGCAVLFLFWMLKKGFAPQRIASAGAPNLRELYFLLAGESDAWAAFIADVEANFHGGKPFLGQNDNPWRDVPPSPPPPPPPPSPPPPPPSGQDDGQGVEQPFLTLTLSGDLQAGRYVIVPAVMADQCIAAGLTLEGLWGICKLLLNAAGKPLTLKEMLEHVQLILVALGSTAAPLKISASRPKKPAAKKAQESA